MEIEEFVNGIKIQNTFLYTVSREVFQGCHNLCMVAHSPTIILLWRTKTICISDRWAYTSGLSRRIRYSVDAVLEWTPGYTSYYTYSYYKYTYLYTLDIVYMYTDKWHKCLSSDMIDVLEYSPAPYRYIL